MVYKSIQARAGAAGEDLLGLKGRSGGNELEGSDKSTALTRASDAVEQVQVQFRIELEPFLRSQVDMYMYSFKAATNLQNATLGARHLRTTWFQ